MKKFIFEHRKVLNFTNNIFENFFSNINFQFLAIAENDSDGEKLYQSKKQQLHNLLNDINISKAK